MYEQADTARAAEPLATAHSTDVLRLTMPAATTPSLSILVCHYSSFTHPTHTTQDPLPRTAVLHQLSLVTEVSPERFLWPWSIAPPPPTSILAANVSAIDPVPELLPPAGAQCASGAVLPLMPGIAHVWVPRWCVHCCVWED